MGKESITLLTNKAQDKAKYKPCPFLCLFIKQRVNAPKTRLWTFVTLFEDKRYITPTPSLLRAETLDFMHLF